MKILRQLCRQPLKTLTGIVLMTLAAAIACLCFGQAIAVRTTADSLERNFSTIALPVALCTEYSDVLYLPEELQNWLDEVSASNPDIIKGTSKHGFLSAYVPELVSMNYTTEMYRGNNFSDGNWSYFWQQPVPSGRPYSCAMLVITLDEVSEPTAITASYTVERERSRDEFSSYADYKAWYNSAEKETVVCGYTVQLTGTITEVVSLHEGYREPLGMIARMTLTMPALEQIEALNLIAGEQYLVYGTDYYDEDWALRGYLADERNTSPVHIDKFDTSKLRMLTQEEIDRYKENSPGFVPVAYYGSIALTQELYEQVNAISMTLAAPISTIEYDAIRENGDGKLLELRPITDLTYTGADGKTVTYSNEEYTLRYQIPTISKLDETVEDFLNSEKGESWRDALARDAVNNQAFAIIGVDRLGYLTDFARGDSRIVEGRDFSAKELECGAKVCIIQENLAAANGLQIGDTITLNLYHTDTALPYQEYGTGTLAYLNPTASFYFNTTAFEETKEYTIVGFFRSERIWPDVTQNEYAFSPNTVFVPNTSVQMEMEHCESILFTTLVIHNGELENFKALAMQSGYEDRFVYYDQGYSVISVNFHNYESMAKQMLTIGIVLYSVLLLLFLLLYPGAQKRRARTMQSLGAGFMRRFAHTFASSIGIVIPASVLGGWIGTQLWDSLVSKLQATAESAVALQIEPGTLLQLSAAQLILAMLMTACVSAFVAAPRGISARR